METDRPQMTIIRRMRCACMLGKYGYTPARTHPHTRDHEHANTHNYVILTAFQQQRWFRERASMLRYTYINSLVTTTTLLNIKVYRKKTLTRE